MKIQSPYGHLIENLQTIRESALLYQGKLRKSEASTRAVLIDPLLRFLGWDTQNPNMVDVEKTFTQSRVDYALYNCDGKVEVIIEAKTLGGNLGEKGILLNLIMYAIAAGVRDIFLTDGVIWEHYSDFAPGNIGSTRTIDITKDNLLDCAIYLIQILDAAKYWPEQIIKDTTEINNLSRQIFDLRDEITTLKKSLQGIQTSAKKSPDTITDPSSPANQETGFIELDKLPAMMYNKKPPKILRLPDGSNKMINSWRDILVECCRFVLANNPSISVPLPDSSGRKVKLFDIIRPPEGIGNVAINYNGRTIYMYIHYDAVHCVTNAIYVMRNLDPKQFATSAAFRFEQEN